MPCLHTLAKALGLDLIIYKTHYFFFAYDILFHF